MNGRAPKRSEKSPAIGATKIGIAVQGRILIPASSGVIPCTVMKYCERKKSEPKMPKNITNETALVAEKARLRKNRSGSIGSFVRLSCSRKKTIITRPKATETSTVAFPQPSALERTMPKVSGKRPTTASTSPRGSRPRSGP